MIAVYWDFDGTLVRHEDPLWFRCALDALRAVDPATPATLAMIRPLRGFPWDDWQADHTAHVGLGWWQYMETCFAERFMALGVPEPVARQAARGVRSRILRPELYPLYEDAADTLDALRRMGCRQAILSNNYPELPEIVRELGLDGRFDAMIVSGEVGYDKPRPELFELAARAFPDADVRVMIGDNPAADIRGARSAGMRAVLVHRGVCPDADACFDTLAEIPAWIASLESRHIGR